MRALVVDDSAFTRAILKRTLAERGFEVVAAPGGSDALRLLSQQVLDLVLIDWNMAGMNGFNLLREIRRQPRYAKIKLVIMTTENTEAEMKHALAAGADEYIMKPFTADVVYNKLRLAGVPVPPSETGSAEAPRDLDDAFELLEAGNHTCYRPRKLALP